MTRFRIEELAAWTQIDGDDEEGVAAFLGADMTWMPMIGADTARITSLRDRAQLVATMTGRPVELIAFVKVAANPIDVVLPPGWPVCPECGSHNPDLMKWPCDDGPNDYHLGATS